MTTTVLPRPRQVCALMTTSGRTWGTFKRQTVLSFPAVFLLMLGYYLHNVATFSAHDCCLSVWRTCVVCCLCAYSHTRIGVMKFCVFLSPVYGVLGRSLIEYSWSPKKKRCLRYVSQRLYNRIAFTRAVEIAIAKVGQRFDDRTRKNNWVHFLFSAEVKLSCLK